MKLLKPLLFNILSKHLCNKIENSTFISTRLKASVIDLIHILILYFPLAIIFMLLSINSLGKFSISPVISSTIFGAIPFSAMIFALINKDYFNGQSIGKRKYGFLVMDIKTNAVANQQKCMLRNITLFLWPIETLLLSINYHRRIGDLIAGTKVVQSEKSDPKLVLLEMKRKENTDKRIILLSLLIAIVLCLISLLPTFFWQLQMS